MPGLDAYLTARWNSCPVCAEHMGTLPEATVERLTSEAEAAGTSRQVQTVAYFEDYHSMHPDVA